MTPKSDKRPPVAGLKRSYFDRVAQKADEMDLSQIKEESRTMSMKDAGLNDSVEFASQQMPAKRQRVGT